MRKHLKQMIGVILLFAIFMMGNQSKAIDFELKEYSEKYQEWTNLPQEIRENTIEPAQYTIDIQSSNIEIASIVNTRLRGLNSQFDLRDNITIQVKNQKSTMECWACSTTTVLETNLALTKNIHAVYSSRHMNYSTSNVFADGTNEKGHNRDVKTGGNSTIATAYLVSGRGPVLETDMPFVNSTDKINLSEIEGKQVQLKVEETVNFPTVHKTKLADGTIQYTNGKDKVYEQTEITSFRNSIKEHIMQYGGVMAYTYGRGEQYYSNQENFMLSKAYYCDEEQTADHAVTIIGWDDNYAITNFNEEHRPTEPGAYIIQNSYGIEAQDSQGNNYTMFDNGYLYISYEDFLIEQQLWGIVKTNDIDYDTIYQYDELGPCADLTSNSEMLYIANIFSREDVSKKEKLNEISIIATKGESYDVYVNSTDGELSKTKLQKVKTVNNVDKTGYYTIKLDNPILLTDSKFAVAIKISSSDNINIPVEAKTTVYSMWDTTTSQAGQSFMSEDMNTWTDFKNINIIGVSNINICLKAFTTQVEDSNITITSSVYKFDNTNCIYKIMPNTSVEDLKKNIVSNDNNYTIRAKDGKILTNEELVGTGVELILSNSIQYTLIVTGDVNGDGKITVTDITKIKRKIVGLEWLDVVFEKAGDIDNSSNITVTDLIKAKRFLVGIEKF